MVCYSHSRLSTFENCPLQYKFKYIDKIKPDFENSIEGLLGTKVHDTLEWLYNEIKANNLPELDDAINYYIQKWNKDYNPTIKIVKDLPAQEYFQKGIQFIIDYFKTHHPFIDGTLETEKKIFINLDNEGRYKLIGFIDRLVHNKDTNIFEIHDYKTSNSLKSQAELDNDRQLALYSLAIKHEFPQAHDIHLIWHFLAFNKKIISKRTDEQLEELKQEIIKKINLIESTTEFPPQVSILCKWCAYRSNCQMFKKGFR